MDFDVIYYPLPDLDWTKPQPNFKPENTTEFCVKQCAIIHRARLCLLEKLRDEEGADVPDIKNVFVGLDATKSKSNEHYYSPTFKVLAGNRTRFFQVMLKRMGDTVVDTQNPIAIREVTE